MPTVEFSVDAGAILREAENATSDAAIGLRYGLREIRRRLHAIGERAIIVGDNELLHHLAALGVVIPRTN